MCDLLTMLGILVLSKGSVNVALATCCGKKFCSVTLILGVMLEIKVSGNNKQG